MGEATNRQKRGRAAPRKLKRDQARAKAASGRATKKTFDSFEAAMAGVEPYYDPVVLAVVRELSPSDALKFIRTVALAHMQTQIAATDEVVKLTRKRRSADNKSAAEKRARSALMMLYKSGNYLSSMANIVTKAVKVAEQNDLDKTPGEVGVTGMKKARKRIARKKKSAPVESITLN